MDNGGPLNLPMTGWEGMMSGSGADSLQQCAILAHSLMSQQFGVRSPQDEESLGPAWDMPMSPMTSSHGGHMGGGGHMEAMGHMLSPVRGQQYHHPHHQPQQHYHEHGQLSPHHDNMSPVMTPVKMPPSPGHPISPDHFHVSSSNHVSSTSHHVSSPPKKEGFIDNNPGFYRGQNMSSATAPQWAPELAIHPSVPTYDELSGHPPITSSLYGQDLRYGSNQYY